MLLVIIALVLFFSRKFDRKRRIEEAEERGRKANLANKLDEIKIKGAGGP